MELLKTVLSGASGAAIFGGLFALVQYFLNRKAKREDAETEKQVVSCTARGQEIEELKRLVINLTTATRVSMYDRIKHIAKTYIARGWITFEEYEDLKTMHESYHNDLGGNGFLDDVMADVAKLPKRAK